MRSAYHVPTPEASLTAVAGRTLQGLGCDCTACNGNGRGVGWYLPGLPSPAQLQGYNLPPMLGRLGAGAGTGRFNRAVSRGIYDLPFVQYPSQGAHGLGQLTVEPMTLALGIGALALAAFLFGSKTGPARRRRRAERTRRQIGTLQSRLKELEG